MTSSHPAPCGGDTTPDTPGQKPRGSETDQLKAPRVPADCLFPQIRIKGANLDFPKTIITMYFPLPGITESYSILLVMQHT